MKRRICMVVGLVAFAAPAWAQVGIRDSARWRHWDFTVQTRYTGSQDRDGKNGSTVRLYFPGIAYSVYGGTHIHPKNLATYKLYVYNPSIGAKAPYGDLSDQACSGNANFWKIYWKYFGNTFAPVAVTPVPSGCDTTTVVLSRPFSRVMYGQQAAISGCLSATPTANLDGAKVRLESLSGSVWTAVPGAEQTVGPGGAFSFPLPSQQISRVRVVFPGTATLAPSVSGCFVSDIVALVSAPARWGSYRAGSVMGLRGSILPAHRSVVRVSIQRRVRGRYRAFRTLTAKTNWWGGWSLGVRLPKGAYRYQVSHNDATHGLGGSTWGSVYIR